jgi:hypothetical protein
MVVVCLLNVKREFLAIPKRVLDVSRASGSFRQQTVVEGLPTIHEPMKTEVWRGKGRL